jgi:hypothetical protein
MMLKYDLQPGFPSKLTPFSYKTKSEALDADIGEAVGRFAQLSSDAFIKRCSGASEVDMICVAILFLADFIEARRKNPNDEIFAKSKLCDDLPF